MEKILLTCIKDPFKPVESQVVRHVDSLSSIRDAVREFFPAPLDAGFDVLVSYSTRSTSARVLTDEEIDTIMPVPGDSIVFTAVPHGGDEDGKSIIRAVAMIAVLIVAVVTQQYWSVPLLSTGMGASTATMVGMSVIMTAGGLLINALIPPVTSDSADLSAASADYNSSNTYGWDPSSNACQEGTMLPVLYGTHRVTPPVGTRYISTDGVSQYLNILYTVCEGGKSGIDSIGSVEINGNPASYYSGINIATRLGTNDQTVIPYFNDTIADSSVGIKLSTSFITRPTIGNTARGLGVGVVFPSGLYYANDNGTLDAQSVTFLLQYKKSTDSEWTDWGTYTVTGASSTAIRRYYRIDDLPASQYDVRIRFTSAPPTGVRYRNDAYFEYLEEIVYDDFSYPGVALLALNALATEQLSNSTPRVTCLASRLTVPVWTGSAYEDKPATNPAWASYDILHNDEYGGGVPYSRIIYEKFAEWAAWCDENGYTCNIYFDTMKNLRKSLDTICTLGRGNVLQLGSKFTCIYDGDTLPTQRFLFTMGNIVRESFGEEWLSMDDRANQVEVTYYDVEQNYDKQTVVIEQDGFDDLGVEISPAQIDLIGCTDRDMAIRHGKYRLNCNRYITNTMSFLANVESIGCIIGDVIEVAHDVPQWGYSGRIVSATPLTVTLDRKVPMEPGKTYRIRVQHIDNDISEELTVESVSEETLTNQLGLINPWENVPVLYTKYSFGEVDQVVKLARIINTTRAHDPKSMQRKIIAVEHVPDVYNDAIDVPRINNISDLPKLAGLTSTEIFRKSPLGGFESVASLVWRGYSLQYWIYQGESENGPWTLLGTTTNRSYETTPLLKEGMLYYFCVTADKSIENGIKTSLYVYGKTRPPSDVQNFNASPAQGGIKFSWDAVADIDIDYYLLKFTQNTSATWNTMMPVAKIYGTSITLPAAMSGKYAVKAVDLNDPPNESETAAYIFTDIPTILKWNSYEEAIEEPDFPGTKTDLVIIDGTLRLDTVLGLDDVEDIDALEDFDTLDSEYESEGSYELDELDLGSVQTCRCYAAIEFSGFDRSQSFDDISDFDAFENFDGNIGKAEIRTQISYSSDGVTYTDWMDFITGDFTARYFKRRVLVKVEDSNQGIFVSKVHFITDMPDRRESGQDIECGVSGINVTFAKPFMAKPKIGITIQEAQNGDYYSLPSSQITLTGFSVAVRNGLSNVERTIDWEAAGY